jgi:hypothetical protein
MRFHIGLFRHASEEDAMNDQHLFEPEDVPAGLAGIDAGLLADLYDLVAKYGVDVAGAEGLRRYGFTLPKAIHVSVTVQPSRQRNMILSPWAGGARVDASHFFMIKDGVASFVLWDRTYSVADVRAAIAAADAEMDAFRDPLSGARRRIASDAFSKAKLQVDVVFAQRGKAVMPGDGIDIETLRQQFDRPDDVAVVTMPDGRQFLCHRRDERGFDPARKEEAILRMLERHGISTLKELNALPKAELEWLYAELSAELFGDEN